jgi:histidinol dehydrogenase
MQNQLNLKVWDSSQLPADWYKRAKPAEKADDNVEDTVKQIIGAVQQRGDAALVEFTEKFDKTKLTPKTFKVTAEEIKAAYSQVTDAQVSALKAMKEKLEFLETQTLKRQPAKTTRNSITVETVMRPLESVGCYVPGGLAVYPSTLVMTATPAKVAGVSRIVVCSPPTANGAISALILVAADICGVNEIYKVGGIQAIAALAYGTQSIKPVRKIVGPGSRYVTAAKVAVSQDVAIDMPAGPSEVLVLADETADPALVAADLISQAEHGTDSVAGLVTPSKKLASDVQVALEKRVVGAEREEIIRESLSKYGFIITCQPDEFAKLANLFAPEHMEILTAKPQEVADKITSAGLILLGPYSPVPFSDYAAGTNHVLPTGGYGQAYSGLSVLDFTRRISVVECSKEGLAKVKADIAALTATERLPNHYKAIEARFTQ